MPFRLHDFSTASFSKTLGSGFVCFYFIFPYFLLPHYLLLKLMFTFFLFRRLFLRNFLRRIAFFFAFLRRSLFDMYQRLRRTSLSFPDRAALLRKRFNNFRWDSLRRNSTLTNPFTPLWWAVLMHWREKLNIWLIAVLLVNKYIKIRIALDCAEQPKGLCRNPIIYGWNTEIEIEFRVRNLATATPPLIARYMNKRNYIILKNNTDVTQTQQTHPVIIDCPPRLG